MLTLSQTLLSLRILFYTIDGPSVIVRPNASGSIDDIKVYSIKYQLKCIIKCKKDICILEIKKSKKRSIYKNLAYMKKRVSEIISDERVKPETISTFKRANGATEALAEVD